MNPDEYQLNGTRNIVCLAYLIVAWEMHQIAKLKCISSCLAVVCAQSIEAMCSVDNEDVVGAAPTGDAPTTSEWSTIWLPTKVCLILEIWR